jgi:hypothetical protein
MLNWLRSLGQFGVPYGGSLYKEFQRRLAEAQQSSNVCAALAGLRTWLKGRNRAARLEVEGKYALAIRDLVNAEKTHNCGG